MHDALASAGQQAFSLVSWNIHRCKGNDGVVDPSRTLDVLAGEVCAHEPDILVLQEADEDPPPHRGLLDLQGIATRTELQHAHGELRHRWGAHSHGFLGVILFAHPSIAIEDIVLLDLPGHCHRGAVVADLRRDGFAFRVVATHLSLSQVLRIVQLRAIGQHLYRRAPRPTILCGDTNEWRPWSGFALSPRNLGLKMTGPALATFPIGRPFLPLDRVLVSEEGRVAEARVLDGPGIRMASDHRPLAANVIFGAG